METGPIPKSLKTLGLMAIVIMTPAVVFAVTGDAPQTPLLAAAGLAFSACLPRPLERTTRSFVYTGLSAAVLAVLSQQVFPIDDKRFFLIPAHVYTPPILFLAVAITFLDQRDSNVAAVIGLGLLAMVMSGNCMDFQVAHQRLPIPARWHVHLQVVYGAGVAGQLLACIPLMARAPYVHGPRAVRPRRVLRAAVVAVLLAAALAGVLALRAGARPVVSFWQMGLGQLLQAQFGRRSQVIFGRDVDLWRTVPQHREADAVVALRAFSPRPPGYLRGRVYTRYQSGRWSAEATSQPMPAEQPGGRLTTTLFHREEADRAGRRDDTVAMHLYPTNQFRSEVLLAPGSATTFELLADNLAGTADGEVIPTEWERQVGYSLQADADTPDRPYPGPRPPPDTAPYLEVPTDLRAPLDSLANAIFADAAPGLPAALDALAGFFSRDFEYTLDTQPDPTGADPLRQFLEQRRRGHCELFASAAVLLLRSRGLPARYVTGLVCQERLRDGVWIARLGDLHAWAEAYDAAAQAWVMVEMTPASGLPDGDRQAGMLDAALQQLRLSWQHVLALMKRGTIAEAIVAAAAGLARLAMALLLNPIGLPLAVLALALLARRWLHRRRHRRGAEALPAPRERLCRAFERLLHALGRRDRDLPPRLTPQALSRWLRQACPSLETPILAEACRRYEALRYGPRLPEDRDIAAIEAAFRDGLKEFQRARRQTAARESTGATRE